jgi:hypothetical protein
MRVASGSDPAEARPESHEMDGNLVAPATSGLRHPSPSLGAYGDDWGYCCVCEHTDARVIQSSA